MIGWIYFFIIILANSVGAISGMGGGVIIKPLMDAINVHPVYAISFYSTVAVLTMSIVSTLKQLKNGMQLSIMTAVLLSSGAVVGGILGNVTFERLLHYFPSGREALLIQIGLTLVTLIGSYWYSLSSMKSLGRDSQVSQLLVGFLLGYLASLLGIGGGPINVALLMYVFGFSMKKSTVYSIVIILFSQLAKILTIAMTSSFGRYDLSVLTYIVPAAIIGGLLGASLSKKMSTKHVGLVYRLVILFVLILNVINGIKVI